MLCFECRVFKLHAKHTCASRGQALFNSCVGAVILSNPISKPIRHRRSQGGLEGHAPLPPNFWNIVILYFERRCPKQNTVFRLKSNILGPQKIFSPLLKFWAGYTTAIRLIIACKERFARFHSGSLISRLLATISIFLTKNSVPF